MRRRISEIRAPDASYSDQLVSDDDTDVVDVTPRSFVPPSALPSYPVTKLNVCHDLIHHPEDDLIDDPKKRQQMARERSDDLGVDTMCSICHCIVEQARGWDGCRHFICGPTCSEQMSAAVASRGCPQGCRPQNGRTCPSKPADPLVDRLIRTLHVRCPNDGCDMPPFQLGALGEKRDNYWTNWRRHAEECTHLMVSCPLGCRASAHAEGQTVRFVKLRLKRGDVEDHVAHSCPERTTACISCKTDVRVPDWDHHSSVDDGRPCNGFVYCVNGCTTEHEKKKKDPNGRKRKSDGDSDQDQKRQRGDDDTTVARSAPKKLMLRRGSEEHEHLNECPRRLIECQLCHESIRAYRQKAHDEKYTSVHIKKLMDDTIQLKRAMSMPFPLSSEHRIIFTGATTFNKAEFDTVGLVHSFVDRFRGFSIDFKCSHGGSLCITMSRRPPLLNDATEERRARTDRDGDNVTREFAVSFGIAYKWDHGKDLALHQHQDGWSTGRFPLSSQYHAFQLPTVWNGMKIGDIPLAEFNVGNLEIYNTESRSFGVLMTVWERNPKALTMDQLVAVDED